MNESERRLLWEYVLLFEPIWEITEYRGTGEHGIYKFWPFSTDVIMEKDKVSVSTYTGYNWKMDGTTTWDFVQKIVDAHRSGKRLYSLAVDVTRWEAKVTWT